MSAQAITLGLLGLAVLAGTWRVLRMPARNRLARLPASLVLASGLALILFPPSWPRDRETLLVLTPGADVPAALRKHADLPVVALRGVDAGADVERAPDLATALRRHPLTGSLKVVGDGLPARDREAVEGLNLAFYAGSPLIGIVDLQFPDTIHAGRAWNLRGEVAGVAGAQVELRDRDDRVVSSVPADAQGRFTLEATARIEGLAEYQVRVSAGDGAMVEEMPLFLNVRAGDRVDVLILAGGPDPELKYLRRWLLDAGNGVASRISLSRGIEQHQDGADTSPSRLAETDMLVVDERAWAALSANAKTAIREAVGQGLGVLLRVTGPVPDKVASDWANLGFALETADLPRSVRLAGDLKETEAIGLTRWPMRIVADDSAPLQNASDGLDLGRWRAVGRGRVGVWLLGDAYRLVLRGESSKFESLWAEVLATLARARGTPSPIVPAWPRAGQRSVVCGLAGEAHVETGEGDVLPLRIEREGPGCAAWWPAQAGSHTLVDASGRWPMHVAEAEPSQTFWRAQTRRETRALERNDAALPKLPAEVPRWLIFLFWLPLAAVFWWLERRR